MNPNDLLAQQQAMLNQLLQYVHNVQMVAFAVSVVSSLILCFVIYMFYARLRGIENELMKFRIAYEFTHRPEGRASSGD